MSAVDLQGAAGGMPVLKLGNSRVRMLPITELNSGRGGGGRTRQENQSHIQRRLASALANQEIAISDEELPRRAFNMFSDIPGAPSSWALLRRSVSATP